MRTLRMLKSASEEEAGAAAGELEDDEIAAAVGRMLRQTAPPTELLRFTVEPGGVDARSAIRGAAKAWAGASRLAVQLVRFCETALCSQKSSTRPRLATTQ